MEIIIDGYNLIGQDKGLHGALESKRNWLVSQLVRYHRIKGFSLTLVFDGWRTGGLDETWIKCDGISVVYSRRGEKADAVILRLSRAKGSGCVVVTSDREVRRGVEKLGAAAVYAGEFNDILAQLDAFEGAAPAVEAETERMGRNGPNRLSREDRRRLARLEKLRLF